MAAATSSFPCSTPGSRCPCRPPPARRLASVAEFRLEVPEPAGHVGLHAPGPADRRGPADRLRERLSAVRRQVGRVVAAVAVVGAAVSGCSGGPSQAGSAVIIGNAAVPLEVVQSRLDVALGKTDLVAELGAQGIGAPEIARDVVTRTVLHDLLDRAAERAGIVVSAADVDAEIAAGGGVEAAVGSSLYDETALRERIRDQLVAVALAERSVGRLAVTADLFAAGSRADADRAAAVIAEGGPEADALFELNPQTAGRGIEYRAATNPEVASTVLFGSPAGSTVVFQPSPEQSGWLVLRITERDTDAPPVEPGATDQLAQGDLAAIGERLVQPLGEEVGVRVNPRYGVWDPIQLRVVGEDQLSGTILPPAAG